MSAPCLIGWASSGANVLSTMTGTPRAWATSAIEARSCTSSRGLPISSRKTALVLSLMARPNADGIAAVDVGRRDADLGQRVGEQVVGAAVERRRRDDVVAGTGEVEDRQRLGGLARGEPERRDAALERGDALLEDVGGRVHDPGVDVPEFLEPEQPGGMRRVIEDVAGRGVDRDGAGVGRRVGLLAAMEGAGLGAEGGRIEFGHGVGHSESGRGGWIVVLAVPAARGGPAVGRTPVAWFGGQTKSRGSAVESAAPGPVSVVPRPSVQDARDLRPHPPHGGAASAYTCSRRRGVSHDRRWSPKVVDTSTVRRPKRNPGGRPSDPRRRSAGDDRHPRHVPRLRRREGRGCGWRPASSAASATFAAADLPAGEVEVRVEWSSVNFKDGLATRADGKVARISPLIPGIDLAGTVVASDDPSIAGGRAQSWPTATSWACRGTAATASSSASRPAGSCRWRPG